MKKKMTKLMSMLLCCVMSLGFFPTAAFAGAIGGNEMAPNVPVATDLPSAYTVRCITKGIGHTAVSVNQIAGTVSIGTVSMKDDSYICPITVATSKYADAYFAEAGEKHSTVNDSISFPMTWEDNRWVAPSATSLPAIDVECEYGVTYSYDNSVPAEVMATLPTNDYTYSIGQKVTTAAKPDDVAVGDYIWKFQTWQLNGVDVAPNTQIEMVGGGLTFTGIWTREAVKPGEYGVTYSYDPAGVPAELPINPYTYSVGQKVTTAAKPDNVTVGGYIWKFQTWQLNGVDVAPNTQIEMIEGGLTFTGIWTCEAVKPAEYGVAYSYDNSVPAEVMATLPTNDYTYSIGQKVTTAAKPDDVAVGNYIWKFQTWQLNGVDVAPNTQIEMVEGGLTFTGIWTREAVKPGEYGVTYSYDPAGVPAELPINPYTYSVGQKVTTAAKPDNVTVGDYIWKFQTWQLNGVDVAPNTQIEMVEGGLTFIGIWTREAVKPAEYGVAYSYDNSVPAEVMATLPTNDYTYSIGQKVTTAAKPDDVAVGDYIWKFQTWQLNGVDVAPNTQIEMVEGGLTFTGIWTREAVKPAEYGVAYSYDNSVPAEVMATLPTNDYTYSIGQKVTTAAKPDDVAVGDYIWKFQTWQLNGVDVAPNTQIEMVEGGLTFTGIWTREAVKPAEYGVTYSYDPAGVPAELPINPYTYSVGQKVTTAAKPDNVTVGGYIWKFQTWELNGVDVAPNTQIEMVEGGLTFIGIWTREAVKPGEYGVTYSYDPAGVPAELPINPYTYSVGQKVTTAAKPDDVTVGGYIWKFHTWQLNGVDVAPNTQIEMIEGGLTFTGIWTCEAVKPAEYGVTYSYDNSVPAEVMATLPTNDYTYSIGQKVTTAAKPDDVAVGDYIWKFQTWQLNGVDVAPNTQIEMVEGGLTFTGIWTREAVKPAEYGVAYSYDNSVPAEVMATLPTNDYTYSIGQKVTTAAKPDDVAVGDYIWKFQTWQLNGVDVAPNTQIEMVEGGLTFTGIWTREAVKPAEYGVTYSYDPAGVPAELPINPYTYSVGQKVTTAAKPDNVTVGGYIWKFQTWELNGVDVAPNTQIEMVEGGLTFIGIWTREAVKPGEYGVTYSYDPAGVPAELPINPYTYSVGQKVTTAAKPDDVTVGGYIWKFHTWQLNGVDVAPNTQIEMIEGGLTFTGIWTCEAVKPAEYGVTYSYDNSVPAEVMATLPTNDYTYSIGQKVTTAAKPDDVAVGDYIWKFQTWELNGVDVAPNTQIEMVEGGLTFTGVWTRTGGGSSGGSHSGGSTPVETEKPFKDVPDDAYYKDAVDWAVKNGITAGIDAGIFDPAGISTRAQVVTFLWRAAGSPAPKSNSMPFADVDADAYYYDAVLWALEEGVTAGTSDTTFSPDVTCTRAHVVTFLWRYKGSETEKTDNPFADVDADDYYYNAVLWAVKNSVTAGTSGTTFSPDDDCTRAQIITFLWRAMTE